MGRIVMPARLSGRAADVDEHLSAVEDAGHAELENPRRVAVGPAFLAGVTRRGGLG
ncbi:hypothetical protein [Micromonospora sp. NPDC023737]|uniref:hypothetical protein n=1 Tax=unclassified Micromonospora TaxID=2617518 RepID=UPI00340135F8